jgi:exopolysaccharide biosynthesis polyprenyl glycosylphosphotransferase
MKNQDDGTLSLFDDFPPAPAAPAAAPSAAPAEVKTVAPKKPRAKRKPAAAAAAKESEDESNTDNVVNVEATLHLAGLVSPQRRQNSPWAQLSPVALHTAAKVTHVLLVITKGEAGGAQSHVRALCEALHMRVRFTVVIGGPAASGLQQSLQALGVTVYPMPEMVETLNPFKLWPAIQQLTGLIYKIKPDLVHAHSSIAGVVARLAGHSCKTPVVYTVHGFGFKPEVPTLRRTAASLAERTLARWTTHMICVSKHERTLTYDLPIDQERVHVIANGLPKRQNPATNPSEAQEDSKDTHKASSASPRLIMVARTKRPKRHDLLLQALARVRDTLGQEIPTTLAGDGPLTQQLKAQAQALKLQDITWAGDVADVSALLSAHDIFVLLSDHEGMPITVLEAMRAGVCVLASDLPGIREQLNTNQEGLLVANTIEAVTEALSRLVQEPYLRKRLARAGQQYFDSTFTVEPMAESVMQVYRHCVQKETELNEDASVQAAETHRATLVSASVCRRDNLQSWALWGIWLLVPSFMAAQLLEDAGLMTYQFGETLWWCVLPYIVAAHLLMRTAHLPVAERSGVLWVATSAPFLFTPLGFALLQQPYSRAALVWAYALTTAWLWLGYHRHVKHRALRLVHIDANVPAQLAACLSPQTLDTQAVQLMSWNAHTGAPLPPCDGIVLDRYIRTTDERTRLLGELKMQHLRLYTVEAVAELTSGRKMLPTAADTLWEIDNDPSYDRVKRLLDLVAVITLSPLWLPLAACVALAVRLDSKGPALYSQPRVGRDGAVFTLWKFRSMVHGLQAPGVHFAQAEDPRITRVGRWIRRTRLDELPQLFNVLMGHMSLIGPRPEQTAFVRDFAATIPCYPYRHLVRPGLTGWAQVQQGYADSTDATRVKLSYDLYYVAHYSLALDLLIAAKTVKTVFTGFGAR